MAAAADSWWWCMRIDGGGRDNVWRVVVSFLCDPKAEGKNYGNIIQGWIMIL